MEELVFKTKQSCSCKIVDVYRIVRNDDNSYSLYVNGLFVSSDKNYIKRLIENVKDFLSESDFNNAMVFLGG